MKENKRVQFHGGQNGDCVLYAVANLAGSDAVIRETPRRPDGFLAAEIGGLLSRFLEFKTDFVIEALIVAPWRISAADFRRAVAAYLGGAASASSSRLVCFLNVIADGLNHCVLCYFHGEEETVEIHDNRRREVVSGPLEEVFISYVVTGCYIVVNTENRQILFIQ